MTGMKLVIPDASMSPEIVAYRQAMLDAGSSMDGCGKLRRLANPADWLAFNEAFSKKETAPAGWGPTTQYVYVREADGCIVGMLQVRWEMNDFLRRFGGHIGYSVRPDERRKGYASAMLADALEVARAHGMTRVMISCLEENEASRRTILRNGGVYESTVFEPEEKAYLERYWVSLDGKAQPPVFSVPRMEKPDWAIAPAVKLTHQPWLAPCDVGAKAQLCHDGERLHVRMTAKESEVRATLTGETDMVCEDSCLEFFLAPDPADKRYFNFEWNPLGTLYLGFGAERGTRVRQLVRDKDALFAPRPFRTADGWGIEFAIPASFIALYFPGFALRGEAAGNFYKCGDRTERPHYLAWAKLTSDHPDYHRRQDFGALRFEE